MAIAPRRDSTIAKNLSKRCHPRIAVLYKTITAAGDDLFHFLIVFGVLYTQMASLATWMFGSSLPEFRSMSVSMRTQFEMIIGDFPFGPATDPQLGPLPSSDLVFYYSYLVIYSLVVFFI